MKKDLKFFVPSTLFAIALFSSCGALASDQSKSDDKANNPNYKANNPNYTWYPALVSPTDDGFRPYNPEDDPTNWQNQGRPTDNDPTGFGPYTPRP